MTTPFIEALSRVHLGNSKAALQAADEVIRRYDNVVAALERAKEDIMNIQEDVNSGEFELDPQFAIDRIEAALKETR
jgi:prefoldin subunit 5